MTGVDFGRRVATVRRGRISGRIDVRDWVLGGVLLVIAAALGVVTLTLGTIVIGFDELLALLAGEGSRRVETVVVEWRLPRLLFAVVAGAALALAGMLMQRVTRNPLGSPDIMGFDAGAYAGVLVVTLVLGVPTFAATAVGAVAGGLATAVLVLLLALRSGLTGFRLIILGIGTAAMLTSVNSYLLLVADPASAVGAAAWNAGSFSTVGYPQLVPFLLVVAPLMVLVWPVDRRLGQLDLGDDLAGTTGVRTGRTRGVATLTSVMLAATVTSVSGPLTFIALVAPQIAVRLSRRDRTSPVLVALTGTTLLVAADDLANRLGISTGLLTICLGGLYLLYLLIKEGRSS